MADLNEDRERRNKLAQESLNKPEGNANNMYTTTKTFDPIKVFLLGAFAGFIPGLIISVLAGNPSITQVVIAAIITGIFNLMIVMINKKN